MSSCVFGLPGRNKIESLHKTALCNVPFDLGVAKSWIPLKFPNISLVRLLPTICKDHKAVHYFMMHVTSYDEAFNHILGGYLQNFDLQFCIFH